MDIVSIFEQMLVLLILLVVGVIAARFGVVDEETNRRLTRMTLIIPQSAMILDSVINVDLGLTFGKIMLVIGSGCAMYAVLIGLGFLVPLVYRLKPADRGVYRFMEIFGNVGFMGFPVVASIFGSTAVFYASIFNIPFNILAYTLGIALLQDDGQKKHIDFKKLISAPLVATFGAILLLAIHICIPSPIADAVGILGDMVVPCSMIIIGASLGNQSLRDVFGDWRTYAFAPARLLVAPIAVWAVLRLFVTDQTILGVATVLAAMPAAAFATMLSIQYGGNEQVASKTVFVTTVISVVTIPLVCWILL
jgi:predicted permease